jgi:hypothetical protein
MQRDLALLPFRRARILILRDDNWQRFPLLLFFDARVRVQSGEGLCQFQQYETDQTNALDAEQEGVVRKIDLDTCTLRLSTPAVWSGVHISNV